MRSSHYRLPFSFHERMVFFMLENIKCKKWWKAAGIRAIKTMAQAAIATIGASTMITETNWMMVASATAMAGLLSLLTSVSGLPECSKTEKEGE